MKRKVDFDSEVTSICHNQAEATYLRDSMRDPVLPIAPSTGGLLLPEDRIPPELGWLAQSRAR